jgi:hypothetical protein
MVLIRHPYEQSRHRWAFSEKSSSWTGHREEGRFIFSYSKRYRYSTSPEISVIPVSIPPEIFKQILDWCKILKFDIIIKTAVNSCRYVLITMETGKPVSG